VGKGIERVVAAFLTLAFYVTLAAPYVHAVLVILQ
jgi:hypothetical protein